MKCFWFPILIIVAWLFENVLHEASHLLCATLKGLKARALYPLPHWVSYEDAEDGLFGYRLWRPWELWKKPWDNAKWFFARCVYDAPEKPWSRHAAIHIAPFVWGITLFISTMIGSTMVGFRTLYLLPFALVGLIDALWWVRGYFYGSEGCDGQRWKNGD